MLKHFSPTTRRLERCRVTTGACRFSVHGGGISDTALLESALQDAASKEDTDTYLVVRDQLETLRKQPELFDKELPVYDELNAEFYDELRARYDAVAKNGAEFHLTPEDNSYAYYCYSCYGPVRDISDGEAFKAECVECGDVVHSSDDCGALLRRSEVLFFDDDEVRRTPWFHSSDRPDWAEAVAAGRVKDVHAGSLHAAEDRVSGLKRRNDETWVYELRLKADATVNPRTFHDDPIDHKAWKETDARFGATRYLNAYEDTGSISLLLDSSQFEIVGRHKVAAER